MSTSTFKILKQCLMCGNMFEAQRVSTKYCSHKCNNKHYKLKIKLDKKDIAELDLRETKIKFKTTALNKALIKEKEFLTVREVARLLNCSVRTAYYSIEKKNIKAVNLGQRITRVKRSDIDKLFT